MRHEVTDNLRHPPKYSHRSPLTVTKRQWCNPTSTTGNPICPLQSHFEPIAPCRGCNDRLQWIHSVCCYLQMTRCSFTLKRVTREWTESNRTWKHQSAMYVMNLINSRRNLVWVCGSNCQYSFFKVNQHLKELQP